MSTIERALDVTGELLAAEASMVGTLNLNTYTVYLKDTTVIYFNTGTTTSVNLCKKEKKTDVIYSVMKTHLAQS